MNEPDISQPANMPVTPIESREWLVVLLLCVLGALHVFIYSAAFPFFGSVDEDFHFDLVVRYSRGDVPRTQGPFCDEAVPYLLYFGSLEYLPTKVLIGGQYPPPPWLQSKEQADRLMAEGQAAAKKVKNHESSQPPLYYALAGLWWRMGRALNLNDNFLLYSVRFLNCLVVAALTWLGYVAGRMFFPEHLLIRLGVPALIAFMPQTAFYSVQNDVLSPLCFGVVFICLARWLRGDPLTFRLAAITGLALAATFLAKLSNLPLLAVAALTIACNLWQRGRKGGLHGATPSVTVLFVCAVAPMVAWVAWVKHNFGDYTGTAAKIQLLGWTLKPFSDWWRHPIFTPAGAWTFLSNLLGTFWQGEILWHGPQLTSPVSNMIYSLLSLVFVGVAVAGLLSRPAALSDLQRRGLGLSVRCVISGVLFLGYLSLIYDFHNCVYPSREHPYFTSGRLILGALIPFLLLFLYGLELTLSRLKIRWVRPAGLAGLIFFMLVCEMATDWPVFSSQFNWYHM